MSRTDRMRRRKRKQLRLKRKHRAEHAGLTLLRQRISRRDPDAIVVDPEDIPGAVKMSEVLLDFVRDELRECETLEDATCVAGIAATAWNLALLVQFGECDSEDEILARAQENLDPLPDGLPGLLKELVERKIRMFPDVLAAILDFEATREPDGFHLAVVWEAMDPECLPSPAGGG